MSRTRTADEVAAHLAAVDADPWQPTTDPLALAVLGKLAEESTELATATTRCIIQGIDQVEPVTKKLNREWLEDEIADAYAAIRWAIDHYRLDLDGITERAAVKLHHFEGWASLVARGGTPVERERMARAMYAFRTRPSLVVPWAEVPPDQRAALMNEAHDAVLAMRGLPPTEWAPYRP